MTARAILFDLDGTLLDTLRDIGSAMNRVLAGCGLPEHPLSDYSRFVGDGAEVLVRRTLADRHPTEDLIRQCLADFRSAYGQCWNVYTKPYPGIPGLLDELAARGLGMAVLSNKPHEFTVRCVEEYLPRWRFAAVLGEQAGRPRKPDPAGALAIASGMRIAPADFVYLGDTAIDMHTALAAGMVPVGVRWGFRPPEELLEAGARHLIDAPAGLLDLLE